MTFLDPGSSINLWQRLVLQRVWAGAAAAEEARLADRVAELERAEQGVPHEQLSEATAAAAKAAAKAKELRLTACVAELRLDKQLVAGYLAAQTARADAAEAGLADQFTALTARAKAAEAEQLRLAEQFGAHARAARAEQARLVDRVAEVERAARDPLLTADKLAAQTARAEAAETEQARLVDRVAECERAAYDSLEADENLAAQMARAEAAEAEQARLADRNAELERVSSGALVIAEMLAAQTARADAAEAEEAQLTARVAHLERALSDEQRSKRGADTRIAELSAAIGVKRQRLSEANALAAKAVAKADAAASKLDDAQTCRLCFVAPRQMLYQPCLHLAVCSGCNDKLIRRATDGLSVAARRKGVAKPECPICRIDAERVTGPVFMP